MQQLLTQAVVVAWTSCVLADRLHQLRPANSQVEILSYLEQEFRYYSPDPVAATVHPTYCPTSCDS